MPYFLYFAYSMFVELNPISSNTLNKGFWGTKGEKCGESREKWGEASEEGIPCANLWQALSYLCSDNAADDSCRYGLPHWQIKRLK